MRMDGEPLEQPRPSAGRLATVLAVEDEAVLRLLIELSLGRAGCRVLLAAAADEALRHWAERKAEIDLLVTDIILPGAMDGLGLLRRLRDERPGLRAILTTGSGGDRIPAPGPGETRPLILIKPYESAQLVAAVHQVMAAKLSP
jgi:CheY-like chemotaxis protein